MSRASRVAVALVLLSASHTGSTEPIENQSPADARGEVNIVNVSGEVQVRGWDRAEVQVRGELGTNARVEFQRDGRRTLIKVVGAERRGQSSTDLQVQVPRDSMLSINTVSADQRVSDVRGAQRLQAVSGEIETSVWGEDLQVKTISGDVRVQGQRTATLTTVDTVSGDISLTDIAGAVDLQTVSGDMQLKLGQLTRARIRTTNGTVVSRSTLSRDARVDAEAVNGDLKFLLGRDPDAQFDIETFNGEIDSCFAKAATGRNEHGPGRELHFTEGAGTARVRIKTLNGGVEICGD